jgi:hypothetical protein
MADETEKLEPNITAQPTVLNNFIGQEVVETNTERAQASFIDMPELELGRYFEELRQQNLRSQTYTSPEIQSLPDTTSVDMSKLQRDFNSFRDQINVDLPKSIEQIYTTLASLLNDMNERDKKIESREVKPFVNDIFSQRSKEINTPPLWL